MLSRRTILHVIDALDYGGAQKLILLLARHWPKASARTIVVVLQNSCQMASLFREAKVPLIILGRPRPTIMRPWSFISYGLAGLRDIVSLCRKNNVDVLVLHLSDAEFIGIPAGLIAGVPKIYVVSHVRELFPKRKIWDLRNFLRRVILKFLYSRVTGIIAVSEEIARVLHDFGRGKLKPIITMLNAIDTENFRINVDRRHKKESLGLDPDIPMLLCVGRLAEEKGHVQAIIAVEKLLNRGIAVNLVLAGDGPLRSFLEKAVKERSLSRNVFFLGRRTDIPELLSAADIFVLPSLYEGTSLALLEAMAAGKPIVTTDIEPHRKILKHGETAILVPPGDAKSLARAIEELLAKPQLAAKIGSRSAEVALKKYDIHQLITALERLWAR